MKNIIKMISVSLISLLVAFSPANASSGVFKLSHDLGFGKDTNLDAITKGRLFQVVIMTQNRLVRKNLDGVTSPELATDWSGILMQQNGLLIFEKELNFMTDLTLTQKM